MKMMRGMCIALLAGLVLTGAASAGVIQLSWAPYQPTDPVGQAGDWMLWANIAQADAVVGWGLDLYASVPVVVDAYGPAWSDIYAAPEAGVALDFAAIGTFAPVGVYGSQVLLAALTFDGVTDPYAQTNLGAHDVYGPHFVGEPAGPIDLNEGFAANPPPTGAHVNWVIPEPSTLALLGFGILGLIRRR